jgi:hypothetical protein
MWHGGILPFRTRTYGWIVQKHARNDQPAYAQGYFRPPSPPPPPPTLQIEWDYATHRLGFPRWGLGKVTDTSQLTMAPWAIEKRSIVAEAENRHDGQPNLATNVVKVALVNRPGKGWLVWRHRL